MILFDSKAFEGISMKSGTFLCTTLLLIGITSLIGLNAVQTGLVLLLVIILALVMAACGLVQNHYRVRVIPFILVDWSILYLLGGVVIVLFSCSLVFLVWSIFKMFNLIGTLLL